MWRPDGNHGQQRCCQAKSERLGLRVPLVRGPLWEVLTAASVSGLSADWLIVSLSDTCTTKDEMFVAACGELASAPNRNQSALVSSHRPDDFHTSVQPERHWPADCNMSGKSLRKRMTQILFFTLPCSFTFVSLI